MFPTIEEIEAATKMAEMLEQENIKLLNFLASRITFGEGLYTKGSLIDYTITYIKQLELEAELETIAKTNKEEQETI